MKAYKTLYVAMVAAALTTSANAQAARNESVEKAYFSDVVTIQTANLAKAERNYAACLASENDGVVESALAHVAMLKLMYPVKEFASLSGAVEKVAAKNASAEIRYKAYLVSSLLRRPKQFAAEARTDYSSPDELFGALAMKIHDVIVSNMSK